MFKSENYIASCNVKNKVIPKWISVGFFTETVRKQQLQMYKTMFISKRNKAQRLRKGLVPSVFTFS